ncbi:DHA1 family tetracycline resistance protein-like MFS transporter [Spirosoma lacussanchae]|uniref:MFS transporter n=1 Tax=Spirosoma lacussanchae TaxID=1884249 RepID=UPI001107B366|nr:MFS transporter [Spirosoma lacussanchae]
MLKNRRLLLIFAIVFVDVVAANGLGALVTKYVVALPLKPMMLTGGTALMLGIQLALSPAIGHWSDKAGRRPVAIAVTITSLISTLFLWPLKSWGYIVNRSMKGGTNGLYAVMRSAVADIAPKEKLLNWSGVLSFMVGAGSAVGGMVTAILLYLSPEARIDAMPTVIVLTALGVLNIGLVLCFKETNDEAGQEKPDYKAIVAKALNALKVITLWRQLDESEKQVPGIKPLFILNMLATLGFGYYAFFLAFLTQSDLNMGPLDTAYFFTYFGLLAFISNYIFFEYIVHRINKRKAIFFIVGTSILLQIGYMFSESSVTLLYIIAGIDAVVVSLIGGLIGAMLSVVTKEGGGQGEVFGNIQALGGVASFVTALVNSLLSGVSMIAPFIFCALSSLVVLWWTMRLPDDARKYTDRIEADQPTDEADEQPQAMQSARA